MNGYKYSWTRRYSVNPQVVGEIVEKLPSRTAEAFLVAAKKKSSPVHEQFEWDDSVAAHQHRLNQARTMINSLQVEVITTDRKPSNVMAFVRKADKSEFYIPTLEADDEAIGAAELRCIEHMRTFKARWKNLQFARNVIAEINASEQSVARKRKKAR
jgi:hypothetical protein